MDRDVRLTSLPCLRTTSVHNFAYRVMPVEEDNKLQEVRRL
jgi:hypothetical protein